MPKKISKKKDNIKEYAKNLFLNGLSLRNIAKKIEQKFKKKISIGSLSNWSKEKDNDGLNWYDNLNILKNQKENLSSKINTEEENKVFKSVQENGKKSPSIAVEEIKAEEKASLKRDAFEIVKTCNKIIKAKLNIIIAAINEKQEKKQKIADKDLNITFDKAFLTLKRDTETSLMKYIGLDKPIEDEGNEVIINVNIQE